MRCFYLFFLLLPFACTGVHTHTPAGAEAMEGKKEKVLYSFPSRPDYFLEFSNLACRDTVRGFSIWQSVRVLTPDTIIVLDSSWQTFVSFDPDGQISPDGKALKFFYFMDWEPGSPFYLNIPTQQMAAVYWPLEDSSCCYFDPVSGTFANSSQYYGFLDTGHALTDGINVYFPLNECIDQEIKLAENGHKRITHLQKLLKAIENSGDTAQFYSQRLKLRNYIPVSER